MIWLPFGFFTTALLYASVGFGGGSTYSALLALAGFDFRLLPILSLACNLVVVSGATIRFARAGTIPWRRALALSLIAAPLAFLGGLTPIREEHFLMLLGGSLVLTGLALLLPRAPEAEGIPSRLGRFMPLIAAPLGYFAGLVGIGGGIFLAPPLPLERCAADCGNYQPVHPDQLAGGTDRPTGKGWHWPLCRGAFGRIAAACRRRAGWSAGQPDDAALAA